MKRLKKILALALAMAMVFSMGAMTAFADETITVTFNANGGTGTMTAQTTDSDIIVLTPNAFTRTNYTFTGWNTASDGSGEVYSDGQRIKPITANMTLYAQWDKDDVTVTYDANGGNGTMDADTLTDGSGTVKSNAFTYTGYTFSKWNTASDGSGTDYAPAAALTLDAPITLYAQWTRNNISVSFDANTGTGNMANQALTAGQGTLAPNAFTKNEYTFIGWNTNAAGTGAPFADKASVDLYEDTTLFAQWSDNTKNVITVEGGKKSSEYNLYRMLDLSVNDQSNPSAYRYVINDEWEDFWTTGAGADYVDTNTSGGETYVVWKEGKDTAAEMEAFGKAAAAYAESNNLTPIDTKTLTADTDFTFGNLDNGYYLITSTYGIAASVASTPTTPVQKLKEKNNDNTADKDVEEAAERNGTSASWGDENDAAVGDTVNYKATLNIVKNSVNVKYHDTMNSGLTWTGAANVKVYTDAGLTTELDSTNYSVAAGTSPETFVVSFTNSYVADLTDATTTVYISYSATLNDDAVVGTPEVNTGKVTWGENNEGESTPTTTETETHEFQILKYDGADAEKNPLDGAKFKLYTTEDGTTELTLAKNAAGTVYRIVADSSDLPDGFTLATNNEIITLASETIKIDGVDSDDYYLEETEAPAGFNKLEDRIKVQVLEDNSLVTEIENLSGATMPSTGGIGTTIFYVVGAILVIGAGVVLITKRRMEA